uniref:Uncharacterized protein n=1 Tax=Strongyloides venezuelensis TaxID=75913 RepID=A0A0K0FMY7_STRVS
MTIQELITPFNSNKRLPYNLECGTLKSIGSRVKYNNNNSKQSMEVGKSFRNYYYYCSKAHLVMDTKISEDAIKTLPKTETEKGFYFKPTNDAYFGKHLLRNNETLQRSNANGINLYYNTNRNCTTSTDDNYFYQRSETLSTTPNSSNESSLDINTNLSESNTTNKVFCMYIKSFVIQDYTDAVKIFHYNKRMIAKNLAKSYKKLH